MNETLENNAEKSPQNYSIEWEDIEKEELDYNFYLEEIEIFFREDFNENIID